MKNVSSIESISINKDEKESSVAEKDDKPEGEPEAEAEAEAEPESESESVLDSDPQIPDETYEPIDYHNVEIKETKPVVLFCRKCGSRLPADSEFCQFCGTKIVIVQPE